MSTVGKFTLSNEGLILDLDKYGKVVGRDNIAKFLKSVGKELRRYDQWVKYQESLKTPKLFQEEDSCKDFITND